MTDLDEALNRLENIALTHGTSQILDQLICEEIEAIRKESNKYYGEGVDQESCIKAMEETSGISDAMLGIKT